MPSHFYAMADGSGGRDPVALARTILSAGARIVQLRLKDASARDFLAAAREIAPLCRERGAIFIVNDRLDIAILSGADGVHLGQDDLPLDAARRIAPPGMIIGVSTHNASQAVAAESGGADYVGLGPIFAGGLKANPAGIGLDAIRAVRAKVKIPIVAIGGITEVTLPEVLAAGADAAAIITDVMRAPDVSAKVRSILGLRAR
ncbi:MAG TPA: thiamine phosphate synthase [Candidatus Binataceae bacterium]|nr:thiamine phosphate synthase [Candidatus Binataceae bacterium]